MKHRQNDSSGPNLQVTPIGIVHSPFTESSQAPVQPVTATGAEGTVEILPEYQAGLADLEGFDRIWLICWLHRAAEPRLRVVPYLDITERGLFATRAPSRPNPIGVSPVRLLGIDGNVLRVADLDLLDNTPLLDIKPYALRFDCFPESRSGWLDEADQHRILADDRFEER